MTVNQLELRLKQLNTKIPARQAELAALKAHEKEMNALLAEKKNLTKSWV